MDGLVAVAVVAAVALHHASLHPPPKRASHSNDISASANPSARHAIHGGRGLAGLPPRAQSQAPCWLAYDLGARARVHDDAAGRQLA